MVAAYEDNGLKLQVGHIERHNPVFKELLKLVNPDNVFYTDICRYSPFSGSGRITDTSVIEDLMIHDVDLLCTLLGNKECIITSVNNTGYYYRLMFDLSIVYTIVSIPAIILLNKAIVGILGVQVNNTNSNKGRIRFYLVQWR